VEEEVLHHEEVELVERLLRVVQIGLGQQRVLADDVHRARGAGEQPSTISVTTRPVRPGGRTPRRPRNRARMSST